ncbi:MAG: hypothetical protein GY747_11905 [Planctomycetes bacterium]|nr:hypothetical protein [Planctomycetota bacterium]MCP4771697.1 hypothetical protein [Planctomycetota bacterium]MCP4860003.1 hypothetical protein [Planctomycetota bacterium]
MRLLFPTVLLAALGLLAFPQISDAAIPQEPEVEYSEEEYGDAEQELADARLQMELSHLRMAAMLTDHNYSMISAEAEVSSSRAALQAFVDYEAELESEMMALEIEHTRDGVSDAQEELAQLTSMYERNDLADATAQVVLERAARSIERQKTQLAISQKTFQAWTAFGKAYQQQELGHSVSLAQANLEATMANQELDRAELEAEIAELAKTIKELEAELSEAAETITETEG